MNDDASPCRIHVYLAREEPVGVVLRRGPSAWSRLSLWRTDTDTFEHGQWLHGRVYPRRCDVSPDGSLFCYFTFKATGAPDVDVDSWAAISRPPHFTALALWPIGTTYFAGGFFAGHRALFLSWLDGSPKLGGLPPWLLLTNELPHLERTRDWPDRLVQVNRLLRDGWTATPSPDDPDAIWERREPGGDRRLMMMPVHDATFESYGGRDINEYAVDSGDGELCAFGRATWADWDQRGRLIVAQNGRLLHWRGPGDVAMIQDFNPQAPDPQAPPAWAREWPQRPAG